MTPRELIDRAKGFLRGRRLDYLTTFKGVPQERVLADLARFCRAGRTTFHADPRVHATLEGRREVWLRIQNHLQMTEDQLFQLYGKGSE